MKTNNLLKAKRISQTKGSVTTNREKVEMSLVEFVERASKENASTAEIAALPHVANALTNLLNL